MKSINSLCVLVALFIFSLASPQALYASPDGPSPPPPPGNNHGSNNDHRNGGGAPLTHESLFLISMALIYGSYKYVRMHRSHEKEPDTPKQ